MSRPVARLEAKKKSVVVFGDGRVPPIEAVRPNVDHLVTEDDTPVDNLISEKNQRLLAGSLSDGWSMTDGQPFLATANVGLFNLINAPAIVPDILVSLDVEVAEDWWKKEHRSYFIWEFGKPPDLVLEIVSNRKGEEDGAKKQRYARMKVEWYVIYDPLREIMKEPLTVYRLERGKYVQCHAGQPVFPSFFPLDAETLPLGMTLWEGKFEQKATQWLRWTSFDGQLVNTGNELAEIERRNAKAERRRADSERKRATQERKRAAEERKRAEAEHQRAEEERRRADELNLRAEKLAEKLRELGIDPESVA